MKEFILNKKTNFIVLPLLILITSLGFLLDQKILFSLPILFVFIGLLSSGYFNIYYLLFFTIPLSIHYSFGSTSLDIPTEPILILLTPLTVTLFILKGKQKNNIYLHPFTIIILCQLFFWGVSILISNNSLLSTKYLLSKLWFILPTFFGLNLLIDNRKKINKLLSYFSVGLFIILIYTLTNHVRLGMGFDDINKATPPFFHNHVNFSTILVLFLPFEFYLFKINKGSFLHRTFFTTLIILTLIGTFLSYTRTSWIALLFIVVAYVILKIKLLKPLLIISPIVLILVTSFLVKNNKYIDFAPDFKTTVFNKGNFEKHLEATYKLEDVSGMERVHRWVGAAFMFLEKPIAGHGTNTFYPTYKSYTQAQFRTYISDNPEKSTTHNYFLMLLSEQGIVGFFLFIGLIYSFLFRSNKLISKLSSRLDKTLVRCTILSVLGFIIHLLLNDLVEVDKFAIIFFFCFVIVMKMESFFLHENSPGKTA